MEGIAKPNYKDVLVTKDGYNNDIILTLNKQFPEAVKQVQNVNIGGSDHYQKGRAIFNYLKYSVKYKKDPSGKQVIQLPARMINDTKSGDCKSKALAAAALIMEYSPLMLYALTGTVTLFFTSLIMSK